MGYQVEGHAVASGCRSNELHKTFQASVGPTGHTGQAIAGNLVLVTEQPTRQQRKCPGWNSLPAVRSAPHKQLQRKVIFEFIHTSKHIWRTVAVPTSAATFTFPGRKISHAVYGFTQCIVGRNTRGRIYQGFPLRHTWLHCTSAYEGLTDRQWWSIKDVKQRQESERR